MNFLLCAAVSKYLGHFPEGLVELAFKIDALEKHRSQSRALSDLFA
jgi:hypothetical protein